MLNQEQKQAVESTEGPLRIIAGAGTGKTFTLINRIDYLIREKNLSPSRILTLTFTNKAAHEFRERLCGMGHKNVLVTTFHSLAARLLRKFWQPEFEIINSKEQENLLLGILQDHEKEKLKDIIADLTAIRQARLFSAESNGKRLEEILDDYEKLLEKNNALDFEGLLIALLKLWQLKPDALTKCQELFDYILVDEYQDVNEIQIEILKKFVQPHNNICVVGDGDQTIYSWRGAKASTMKDFENIFPDAISISLTKNYRNPPSILKGAEELIKNNPERIKKSLEPTITEDNKINLWKSGNEFQQYEVLFYLLEKYLGSTSDMHIADELDTGSDEQFRTLSDIAILYRTQVQGKLLAEHLTKKGYPYQISSSEYFWHKKEIVDFVEDFEKAGEAFTDTDEKFSDRISGLIDNFIDSGKFSTTQINRLKHLIPYSVQFDNLEFKEAVRAFLDEIKTEQEADNLIYADRINLLTLHAAKGLEFPIVLIFGLEEGEIPYKKLKDDPYYLAEERRLLYVGMTRAKEELHLFHKQNPSRFLSEIGKDSLFFQTLPQKRADKLKRKEFKKAQMSLF